MAVLTLSREAPVRGLQTYGLTVVGLFLVGIAVVGTDAIIAAADDPSSREGGEIGLVPFRAVLGVLLAVAALRLPLLVRNHSAGIGTIEGLKGQYVTAAIVTGVLGALGLFFWWTGLAATLVALVALALALRISSVPADQQRPPDVSPPQLSRAGLTAYADEPRRSAGRTFALAVLGGLLLGVVIVVVVFLAVG